MVIYGDWLVSEDGTARPIVRGEVLASDGSWIRAPFLLDTGADCTVLSQALLALLGLPLSAASDRIGGLGGAVASVTVDARIRLTRENGGRVMFRGKFAAVTDLEALDLSVLGRDISGLFAAIVDQPGDTVCLVGQRHRYAIVAA